MADADIAEHSVVKAREQSPVAAALIPGDDVFDQLDQRASENGAKTGAAAGALRARRSRWVKEVEVLRTFLSSAHSRPQPSTLRGHCPGWLRLNQLRWK